MSGELGLEIRLLGPFEVIQGGQQVTMRQGRLRVILAALALAAGQVVSADALAERLWGGQLPGRPRDGVQNHVRRLRQMLDRDVIRTVPSGYTLDVAAEHVDALRFLRLVEAAERAGSDIATSSDQVRDGLRAALRLWRGEPLEGVEAPSLRDEYGAVLTERRLAALERRFDLDLTGGAALADLIAELRELVARHPLRESLWTRLLTALHRAGRQAEALEVYHAVRARLADELGVEPSGELRRIYQTVLAGDALVDVETPLTTTGTASHQARQTPTDRARPYGVPRQLPRADPGFVGRAQESRALDDLLASMQDEDRAPRARTVVIHGSAGIGKTALVTYWAHRTVAQLPDGQIYLNLRGYGPDDPVLAQSALAFLLHSAGVPESAVPVASEERAALWRTVAAGRRMLIVLDNARDADQVRPLLLGGDQGLTLVTSRNQLRGLGVRDGARHLLLGELDDKDATALVTGAVGAQRTVREPTAVAELISLCGGLPLALRIVAELAVRYPEASLAELAEDLRCRRLERFADPDDTAADLRAVFSWSYQRLSGAEARTFRLLSKHPGRVMGLHAASALAGRSADEIHRSLDRLVATHLVEERLPGRYHFHDLLREYARERAEAEDPIEESEAAIRRVLEWYLRQARAAAERMMPGRQLMAWHPAEADFSAFPDSLAALDWYDMERESLTAAVGVAAKIGADEISWRLADALSPCFLTRTVWEEAQSAYETALAAATRVGDPAAEAAIRTGIGNLWVFIAADDGVALPYYRRALKLFREVDARAQESHLLALIASSLSELGDHDAALRHFDQSLVIAREIAEPAREAVVLCNLAITLLRVGRPQESIEASTRALENRRGVGDVRGAAHVLDNLGDAHMALGDYAKAATCYREALTIVRTMRDRRCEAIYLGNLARAERGAGRGAQARLAAEQAWSVLAGLPRTIGSQLRVKLRDAFPDIARDLNSH